MTEVALRVSDDGSARSFPGLDLIRLIAAGMVALYHFGFYHPLRNEALPLYRWADSGWCGVHIFFVISGFVIAFSASRKKAGDFVFSRAGRLYPAAWICATISMILAPRSLLRYLKSVTLFPVGPAVNGVYWSLNVEVCFYALIALGLWRGWSLYRVAVVLGLFSTASWLIRSFGLDLPVGPLGHYGCYFAFGMLLYERRSPALATVFFLAGFVGVYWTAADLGFGFVAPFVWAVATLLCTAAVFWNAIVVRLAASWPTRALGLMTYPLYLIHDSVGTPLLRYGVAAALAVSLAIAFAIMPVESAIRRRLFVALRDRLPTGNPV